MGAVGVIGEPGQTLLQPLTPWSLSQGGTTLPQRAFPYMRLEKGAL